MAVLFLLLSACGAWTANSTPVQTPAFLEQAATAIAANTALHNSETEPSNAQKLPHQYRFWNISVQEGLS